MSRRQIFKGRNRAEHDVEHLLQSILAAELISPSELLWLVSPWVSDVAVLDNRSGALTGLEPTWASRSISLVEVLVALLGRGTRIVVATRTDAHNRRFLDRLAAGARAAGVDERLRILQDERERLHEKGLLGDDYYLSGSMNFTQSGIRLNDEAVKYELDEEAVARARVHFRQHYGAPGT
jgi:phosphatidylserine/phosphatidylglycerophosphate/cardiolipin synthase-like enzyme